MREVRLKHIARVAVSNVDKKSAEGESSVRLCNYTDVYYNDRIRSNFDFMRATASIAQLREFRLVPGDVLITKDSETSDDIAVPARVETSAEDLVCGYHLALIRPDQRRLEPRYLFWTLASTSARDWFSSQATGVTRFGLRTQSIADVPIRLPSLKEQAQVADFLDTETARIDAFVEKKQQMIELLRERWATSVRERLGRLTPVVPLKRKWRVVDCKHQTPSYVDDGYPVVSPGDISQGRIDLSVCNRFVDRVDFADLTEGRKPRRGDIIYSRNASAGIASYIDTDAPFCMGQDVCLITSRDEDQRFLMYVLNSLGSDQLEPLKIGSTITRINVEQIGELAVPAPAVDVQRKVAEALDLERGRMDRLVQNVRRQIRLLREHRRALITAAVTGQLDAPKAAA